MIQAVLSKSVQSFIQEHHLDDPVVLLLKYKTVDGVPISIVVDQIVGRRKAKEKLPTWYSNGSIVYPPAVNLEQSSSERTALYKSKLFEDALSTVPDTSSLLDLTGGFGVDSYFLSRQFKTIHFVEPNTYLLEIAKHNHQELGANNFQYYTATAEQFLRSDTITKKIDLIFIDPSRRSIDNRKVFSLAQCDPNIVLLQENLWEKTENLLLKASPLLDIEQALRELRHVKNIFIVSVYNECKELLFYCQKSFNAEPSVEAINLNDKEQLLKFNISEERAADVQYHDPSTFLYEPNASILKGGAFKIVSNKFGVFKIHPNTHLYTSERFIDNFPGRIFKIEAHVKPDSNILTNFFPDHKANILVRNYPLSVNELRKKTRLRDGGDKFLIGCTGLKKKFLLVAAKLNHL